MTTRAPTKRKPGPTDGAPRKKFTHGGARPGAGRKPNGPKAGVLHRPRPAVSSRHPVYVTLQLRNDMPDLRSKRVEPLLVEVFAEAKERFDVRLTHFSVEPKQVHLLISAPDSDALSQALQGLTIRLAKRLNALLSRKGTVFADRYAARSVTTPEEKRSLIGGMTEVHGEPEN